MGARLFCELMVLASSCAPKFVCRTACRRGQVERVAFLAKLLQSVKVGRIELVAW
jgi:hypothetical protein